MTILAERECIPCKGDTPTLTGEQIAKFQPQVPEWSIENTHNLKRRFLFQDFRDALVFVNKAGELAEQQGHHPDICFGWGYAEFKVWTHAIDGLSESDFILAAKIDRL
jgi:4a-hydroxytetrahydrobiopterin dehydratase